MRNDTRREYGAYLGQIAALNGVAVADLSKKFAVDPTIQQRLENAVQQSSDFLSKINIVGVDEMEGEKIGLGVSGTIAGRTDTSANPRETKDMAALDSQKYKVYKTDFDTHMSYQRIDSWAKFKDFQTRLQAAIARQQALDRIMIGFNGTSAAATTNRTANPLLQDVNIGWLEQIRTKAPESWMKEVAAASGKVQVGAAVTAANGYKSLDALVYDVVNELIDPVFAEDPGLVVICGRQLLSDKYFPMLNQSLPATEQLASDMVISQKRMGGLQAVRAPYVPANALLVTTLDNLSIYYQNGSRRRSIIENPSRDRIEDYQSSNEAYVVENYLACALVENIELVA